MNWEEGPPGHWTARDDTAKANGYSLFADCYFPSSKLSCVRAKWGWSVHKNGEVIARGSHADERIAMRRAVLTYEKHLHRWTLKQGVAFCTMLIVELEPEYYVGMTGSVLYRSAHESAKDLDIVVYPASTHTLDGWRTSAPEHIGRIADKLEAFGMKRTHNAAFVQEQWRKRGSLDEKHVEVWDWNGKRVDVFFFV